MFGSDRAELRAYYFKVWQKHQADEALEPLEQQILQVIQEHPEYHIYLTDPERYADEDFSPETGKPNPFMHMGMHLAIREQLGTNRPAGIRDIYMAYMTQFSGDAHVVEHNMMEVFAEAMWEMMRQEKEFDEGGYLQALRKRLAA